MWRASSCRRVYCSGDQHEPLVRRCDCRSRPRSDRKTSSQTVAHLMNEFSDFGTGASKGRQLRCNHHAASASCGRIGLPPHPRSHQLLAQRGGHAGRQHRSGLCRPCRHAPRWQGPQSPRLSRATAKPLKCAFPCRRASAPATGKRGGRCGRSVSGIHGTSCPSTR